MSLKNIFGAAALALAFALACSAAPASAAEPSPAAGITVDHPYARATPPGQPNGGGFLTIVNKSGADRLVAASAEVSKSVEMHSMSMEGDVMHMRQVDGIDLPAGKSVELKPGAYHLMFIGLKSPLKAGDSFPLKLKFARAGELTVAVKVEAAGAMPEMKMKP